MTPKVCAVSYLNTLPLVWGMLHGEQRDLFDLSFCLPSECARRLARREATIGIVPVIEMARQGLEAIAGTGIACRGAVRSILLISKKPFHKVRTLATDASSRTSAELARIILARRYDSTPHVVRMAPDLERMLEQADGALIIGDPALRLDPSALPYQVIDLGEAWWQLTGLPMVFAVWAGPKPLDTAVFRGEDFLSSYRFGATHLEEIVSQEHSRRHIPRELAYEYLSHHIVFELGPQEYLGLARYLELAGQLPVPVCLQPASEVGV